MPRCEGLPDGRCPDQRNDSSVKNGEGDLMLCKRCDSTRHQMWLESKTSSSSSSSTNISSVDTLKSGSLTTVASSDADVMADDADVTATSSVSMKSVDNVNVNKVVICELLFFAINNMDNHPLEKVKEVTIQFYREDEILAAKNTLIQEAPQAIKHLLTEKYGTRRSGLNKIKNTVGDIFSMLDVIDSNGYRESLPVFCAANIARIPSMPDEMSDLTAVRFELETLRKQVETLTSTVRSMIPPVWKTDMNNIDDFPPLSKEVKKEVKKVAQKQTSSSSFVAPPANDRAKSTAYIQPAAEPLVVNDDISEQQLIEDDKTWEQQKKKNKRSKKAIVGRFAGDASFAGVAKKSVVCVTRLKPGTSIVSVSNHLTSNGIQVLTCYDVSPQPPVTVNEIDSDISVRSPANENSIKFSSMRVCVYSVDLPKLYDSSLWPLGVVVRPWTFKSKD